MNSEVRKFVREARASGWRVVHGGKHPRLIKGRAVCVLPNSPSCRRWRDNARRDMRRAERRASAPAAARDGGGA